jgi:hypothetical protein
MQNSDTKDIVGFHNAGESLSDWDEADKRLRAV